MINTLGHRFRPRLDVPVGIEPREAGTYADKVLATQPGDLIAYWPLWEADGATADNYEGTAARDGTYIDGPTLGQTGIGDGETCPSFDGSDDLVDVYSVSLKDAWNGQLFTILMWLKVSGVGIWTDSAEHYSLHFEASTDGNNLIRIGKYTNDNRILLRYKAGGINKEKDVNDVGPRVDFFSIGMTVSLVADEMIGYYDGSAVGATVTGLGTWANDLNINRCTIGANTLTPNKLWSGFIAHVAIWDKVLTATEMASLASV